MPDRFLVWLTLILLFFFWPSGSFAAGRTVVVALNRTTLGEVAADRELSRWLERGALGLLNTGTAARQTSEHVYVTLGAGSRALGTESTRLAFGAGEEWSGLTAREVFERHQGQKALGKVLLLSMAEINAANRFLPYPVVPGLLGETLRAAGRRTAVIGNADGQYFSREAVAMLADSNGQVALGEVGRTVLKMDNSFPFGLRIDREAVLAIFKEVWEEAADVVLVDWGDTARLDEYRPLLTEEVAAALRREIFMDVAWFLEQAACMLEGDDLLVVLAPAPPVRESAGGLLSYILVIGRGFDPGLVLTSATTRRPGLVAITDLAPLILEKSGLPVPGEMLGRTITVTAGASGAASLLRMRAEIENVFRLRPPLLKTYVFFQIVIVLGALLNLLAHYAYPCRFEIPLLALLVFPLVVLYLPLGAFSPPVGFALVLVLTVSAALFLGACLKPVANMAVIGLATSLSLVVDLLRDAPLMKASVLGYDPVSGARYYGIGNEYMGVLIGSVLLGVTALLTLAGPRLRRLLTAVMAASFILLILLMVSPAGGANFGGMLSALAAFLVTAVLVLPLRPSWRCGVGIMLLLSLIGAVAVLINLRIPSEARSHLGRTLELFGREGWQAMVDVAVRKAAMNARLFRYSQWTRAFLAFLGVLAVLFFRPSGVLAKMHQQYPDLAAGFLGIIAGSLAAFFVNDSGVVAAATTLLFAGIPIIFFAGRLVEEGYGEHNI